MNQPLPFKDLLLNGLVGLPEVVALDANTFSVSDWNGVFRKVDWLRESIETSPSAAGLEGLVGGQLRSLSVAESLSLIGAATTAPWAAIWDLNSKCMEKVFSQSGKPVHSVTFSPNGQNLVLGTGFYPLGSSDEVEAEVEIWSRSVECWLGSKRKTRISNSIRTGYHKLVARPSPKVRKNRFKRPVT